jgi:hypothetical protein
MSELSNALSQRVNEAKELKIVMTPGQKPVVEFKGFWSGKFITAAMNSVAKAYRIQARNMVRPRAKINEEVKTQSLVTAVKGEKGDGK